MTYLADTIEDVALMCQNLSLTLDSYTRFAIIELLNPRLLDVVFVPHPWAGVSFYAHHRFH